MKRPLLCVAVLMLWGVAAYLCYRVFGSELAGYIVGVVGAAGTFAAMFLTPAAPSKQATFDIKTEGNQSPGYVGRDFTVGTGAAWEQSPHKPEPATDLSADPGATFTVKTSGDLSPGSVGRDYTVATDAVRPHQPEPAAPSAPASPSPASPGLGAPSLLDAHTITTSGNFSPGFVNRDYINQTIIHQYQQAKRTIWRELEEAPFSMLSDSGDSHNQLWTTLSEAAALTFRNNGFTRFNFILHRREQKLENDDKAIPVYTMLTHKAAFCATAHNNYLEMFRDLFAWKQSGATPEGRLAIEQKHQARVAALDGWTKSAVGTTKNGWTAIQCTCDSAKKSCDFRSVNRISLDPADYDQHLRTTSEMLVYVVSALSLHTGFMGDIGWAAHNYPLMKLLIKLMDERAINMGDIRCNANDDEEWDYLNGAFDAEIGRFATS